MVKNPYDCKKKLDLDNSNFIFHPYYKKCIYNESKERDVNIYNFGFKAIDNQNSFNEFFPTIDYNEFLDRVIKANELFIGPNLEFGGGKNGQTILSRLKNKVIIENFHLLNHLFEKLLPSIENNIYNSRVKIIDINAYKNRIHSLKNGHSSWLWHFDNHPNELMKMMIYLTDVDEESSPLEIIVDDKENPIRLISDRINKKDFDNVTPKYFTNQYNGNRFSEKDIISLKNIGYKIKRIYGKKGTIILFSENIIHRATYPKTKERNVINTVLSPSLYNKSYFPTKNYKWFEE